MNTKAIAWSALAATLAMAGAARAQPTMGLPQRLHDATAPSWQDCQRLTHDQATRLACFDHWARQQTPPSAALPPEPATARSSTPVDAAAAMPASSGEGCRDRRYSAMSRFWELEDGSDCGIFTLRSWRPLNVSLSVANRKPSTPSSPAAGHAGTAIDYQLHEMRLGLSVRTKLAQSLLTPLASSRRDSLWFGYTQQSTWQLFNGSISRPFRSTDHEPELIYIHPIDARLPGGWRWRYAGFGLVHQSNGQSLPYSRSWNRLYLMGGLELDDRLMLGARVWQRLSEAQTSDDNPDISDYIGRAELVARWNMDRDNTLGFTLRHNLRDSARGSLRLEWLKLIGEPTRSNLRFHAQLFHGYGDTLVDYNRRRTVLSVGLSLVDF